MRRYLGSGSLCYYYGRLETRGGRSVSQLMWPKIRMGKCDVRLFIDKSLNNTNPFVFGVRAEKRFCIGLLVLM